jgi:uncharacterized DUF497 family protein
MSKRILLILPKHGVWFEEAKTVWADVHAAEFFDPDHSEAEDRYVRVGYSTKNKIILVIFCERDQGQIIRIISARKAIREEIEEYEKGI